MVEALLCFPNIEPRSVNNNEHHWLEANQSHNQNMRDCNQLVSRPVGGYQVRVGPTHQHFGSLNVYLPIWTMSFLGSNTLNVIAFCVTPYNLRKATLCQASPVLTNTCEMK